MEEIMPNLFVFNLKHPEGSKEPGWYFVDKKACEEIGPFKKKSMAISEAVEWAFK